MGRLLAVDATLDDIQAQSALVAVLSDWTERLKLPCLCDFGVTVDDIPRIVKNARGSSMQTNPIVLTDEEIAEIVLRRLMQ